MPSLLARVRTRLAKTADAFLVDRVTITELDTDSPQLGTVNRTTGKVDRTRRTVASGVAAQIETIGNTGNTVEYGHTSMTVDRYRVKLPHGTAVRPGQTISPTATNEPYLVGLDLLAVSVKAGTHNGQLEAFCLDRTQVTTTELAALGFDEV